MGEAVCHALRDACRPALPFLPCRATGAANRSRLPIPGDCAFTRWWWMGNALSKEDITFQFEQMRAQGIGGASRLPWGRSTRRAT